MWALRPGPANRGPFVVESDAPTSDQTPALLQDVDHDWAEGHDQVGVVSDYQQSDELQRQIEDGWGWTHDDIGGHLDETLTIATSAEPIGLNEPAPPVDAVYDFNAEDGYDDPSTDLMAAALGPVIPNAPPLDMVFADEWDHSSDEPALLVVPDSYQQSDELVENPVRQEPWIDDDSLDDWTAFLDAATGADTLADAAAPAEWDWADDDPDGWWHVLDATQDPSEIATQDEWSWADDATDDLPTDDPIGPDAPLTVADETPDLEAEPDDWWHALEAAQDIGSPDLNDAPDWLWEDAADEWAPDEALQAPVLTADQPLDTAWLDDETPDDLVDDSTPVGPDADAQRADEWDWDVAFDDLLSDDRAQDVLGASFIAPETDIDWASEDLPLLAIGTDYQQSDAPVVDRQGFDDVVFDPESDDDFFDDFGNEEVPVPPQPAEETWFDSDAFEDVHEGSAPVGANGVPAERIDDAPDFTVEVDDDFFDDFGNEDHPALTQDEPELALDVGEEVIEPSGPVGPDAQQQAADQPPEEPWFDAEAAEDAPDDSAPVGADEVQPLVQAEPDFVSDLENDWIEPSEPVGANAPEDAAIADAPTFDDDAEDPPPLDEYRNENEPDPPQPDGWEWQEPPADDDSPWIEGPALGDNEPITFNEEWSPDEDSDPDDWWHADIQHPLVDFVPLPGPVYEEAWDFDIDSNDADSWWANLTTLDTDGGQVDQCPILLAEAYARIAELEALLAECRLHQGQGGGGGASGDGDDIDHGHGHHGHNRDHDAEQRDILREREKEQDEKRRRIEEGNRLLLALAGALIHGLKGPEK